MAALTGLARLWRKCLTGLPWCRAGSCGCEVSRPQQIPIPEALADFAAHLG